MCVVSNVFTDQTHKWDRDYFTTPIPPYGWPGSGGFPKPPPTKEEIEDFIRRLEEAKAQDEAEGNADCGTEEKKAALLVVIGNLIGQFEGVQDTLRELQDVVNNL